MDTHIQIEIYEKGDLEQGKKKNNKRGCSKVSEGNHNKTERIKSLLQHVNMKTTSVLISIIIDLTPPERQSKVDWKKHTCGCTISTHLAVKKPVKPFKLIDNEPGKICSKGAHAITGEKVKHRLVRPTDRLKSFAAGQQDHEMQFKLTNCQNHIMKISLTPL